MNARSLDVKEDGNSSSTKYDSILHLRVNQYLWHIINSDSPFCSSFNLNLFKASKEAILSSSPTQVSFLALVLVILRKGYLVRPVK